MANRHPWIFEGSIVREEGPPDASVGELIDSRGQRLAMGFYSLQSQIRLRAWTFGEEELSESVLRERIRRALDRRASMLSPETDALRMANSEGDDLSGLVIDRYGSVVVLEITSAGLDGVRELILSEVREALSLSRVVLRNDLPSRKLEGLSLQSVVLEEGGEATAERSIILENGLRFEVDPREGQKTGFFLDQRENRALAEEKSEGRKVLNLFSYSGAFGVYAMRGGASSVEQVDVSRPALELAEKNHRLNDQQDGITLTQADAFEYARALSRDTPRFGLVICDPPAFARSRRDVEKASRGYKDINLHALQLVERGGHMMTFSCSGHVSLELFQKIIFSAALDAGRRVSIVRRLGAGADHPVSLYCPEGEYLQGMLLRVDQ